MKRGLPKKQRGLGIIRKKMTRRLLQKQRGLGNIRRKMKRGLLKKQRGFGDITRKMKRGLGNTRRRCVICESKQIISADEGCCRRFGRMQRRGDARRRTKMNVQFRLLIESYGENVFVSKKR